MATIMLKCGAKEERRVVILVFQILLFSSGITAVGTSCLVSGCSCELSSKGLVANCRNQRLKQVPVFNVKPGGSDVVYYEVTLDSNLIRSVEGKAFSEIKVKRLVLTNNPIGSIADDAFDGLETHLVDLSIQVDESVAFPTKALSSLHSLEILEIVGYAYEPALPPLALESLAKLRSLSLTAGQLSSLISADFTAQKERLSYLNLRQNQFGNIPTSALGALSNLTEVYLDANKIATVGRSAFEGVSKLRLLDLSRNDVTSVDQQAFTGLESTLSNLSLQSCRLGNAHLMAIIPLGSLTYLDISHNYIDKISEILANMQHLEVLKASGNRIASLKKSHYLSMSNSLKVLYLDSNPLDDVDSDTFAALGNLQELYLDGAKTLVLDANSFESQKNSLQLLSLRSVGLPNSPWPAVSVLSAVRTVWMSTCGLTEVPDFAFRRMSQLENLDLNHNAISNLTQRSMHGLSNSLVRLYLTHNQLRSIDECVFNGFNKLDVLQLQLTNNPLQCDCGLKWLHDRLRPYKKDPATEFRVNALRWTCANLGGKLFVTLNDSDFRDCTTLNPEDKCEKLDITTPIDPTFSDLPTTAPTTATGNIKLRLTEVTHDSVLVSWWTSLSGEFAVTCTEHDGDRAVSVAKPLSNASYYKLTGLSPQTRYIICLEVAMADRTESACDNTTTTGNPGNGKLPVILAASLAAGGFVVLSLAAVLIYFSVRRFRQSRPHRPPLIRSPTVGRQSKRYRRTNDRETTLTELGGSGSGGEVLPEEALIHTLVTMTDEQRDRVVTLLTNSINNLDDIDRKTSGSGYVGGPRYGRIDPVAARLSSSRDKHEYEEIPDTIYDELRDVDAVTNLDLGTEEQLEIQTEEKSSDTEPVG